jgi:hypothetical protein
MDPLTNYIHNKPFPKETASGQEKAKRDTPKGQAEDKKEHKRIGRGQSKAQRNRKRPKETRRSK